MTSPEVGIVVIPGRGNRCHHRKGELLSSPEGGIVLIPERGNRTHPRKGNTLKGLKPGWRRASILILTVADNIPSCDALHFVIAGQGDQVICVISFK